MQTISATQQTWFFNQKIWFSNKFVWNQEKKQLFIDPAPDNQLRYTVYNNLKTLAFQVNCISTAWWTFIFLIFFSYFRLLRKQLNYFFFLNIQEFIFFWKDLLERLFDENDQSGSDIHIIIEHSWFIYFLNSSIHYALWLRNTWRNGPRTVSIEFQQ